jgi:putative ABC transport system permease protein
MLILALRTVRFRKAGFIGACVALFLATALIGACGIMLETGLQGVIPAELYAGAPIVVAGHQNVQVTEHEGDRTKTKTELLAEHAWIPASVTGLLSAVPGVRAAIPELTFPAYVVIDGQVVPGPGGTSSWGHPWDSAPLTPFILLAGRAPVAPDELVVDADLARRAGLHVGSVVTVEATAAPASYRLVGIAEAGRNSGGLSSQSTLFFSSAQARRLAGHPGRVTAVGVLPDPGIAAGTLAERVSRALSGTPTKIYTGAARGPLEFPGAANARVLLISLSGVLGGTALLVAILVVTSAFGLSVQQRSREIALLRAVAATPRQIRAMIGREALLVGTLAGVAGCAVSVPAAVLLQRELIKAGAIPGTLHLAISPLPVLAAIVAALTAGWIAARLAARRSIRIRPAEALTEATAEPSRPAASRVLVGLVFLAGGAVLTAVLTTLSTLPAAMPVTFVTALVWVMGLTVLGPVLSRAAAVVLSVPLRGSSRVGGYLAAASTRANARRLAAALMPLSLAIAMTCTILFAQTTLGHAAQLQAQNGTTADYELSAPDAPGIPGAAAGAVRRLPGVTAVTEVVHTSVRTLSLTQYAAQGVTPEGLGQTLNLDVRAGSLGSMGTGTVALSTTAASGLGARVGGWTRLWLGDGTLLSLRVVAIYARGLGFGDITLARDLVAAHVDDPLDDTVLIKTVPGATGVAAALLAIARGYPGVRVLDRAGIRAQEAAQQRVNADVQYLEMALIILFTAIAVVNALTMATAGRAREFALLRLIGTSRGQVLRMMRWESLVVTLVAVILGSLISAVTLTAFSLGITGSYSPYIPPLAYLAVIAVATALTFSATEVTVRGALRGHPSATINASQ